MGNTQHASEEAAINHAMDDLSRLRDQLAISVGGLAPRRDRVRAGRGKRDSPVSSKRATASRVNNRVRANKVVKAARAVSRAEGNKGVSMGGGGAQGGQGGQPGG